MIDWIFIWLGGTLLGVFAFKLWDRLQSGRLTGVIRTANWLGTEDEHPDATQSHTTFTQQEIYDFANSFLGTLKGALAAPSPVRLQRLGTVMCAPQTYAPELWTEISVRLTQAQRQYPAEYSALLDTVAQHSGNNTQRHTALKLASTPLDQNRRLKALAQTLSHPLA